MNNANQVFRITDLVRYIADFKHQFERASDLEKLNSTDQFQILTHNAFHPTFDTGMIIRNLDNSDRLSIIVCLHNKAVIVIRFQVFEKHKKLPYYIDILLLDIRQRAIDNQRKLANNILKDEFLLPFFKNTNISLSH